MGCSASSRKRVNSYEQCRPLEDDTKQTETNKHVPEALNTIMNIDVDRSHPMYLYALFCVTRLAEEYQKLIFPNITVAFGSFMESEEDYVSVIRETYESLDYNELSHKNQSLSADIAAKAKLSIQELAYMYVLCAASDDIAVPQTVIVKVAEEYNKNQVILKCDDTFRVYYEDTLKLVITDLERKQIYTPNIFYSNRRFQEWLKIKEFSAWQNHRRNSVIVNVPIFVARGTNVINNSNTLAPYQDNMYMRYFSRDSIDSVYDNYSPSKMFDQDGYSISLSKCDEEREVSSSVLNR